MIFAHNAMQASVGSTGLKPWLRCTTARQPARARGVITRFQKDDNEGKRGNRKQSTKADSKEDKELQEAISQLKQSGVDSKVAKKVLSSWQDQGLADPKSIKGAFVKGGLSLVGAAALQSGLDALASYSSFQTAAVVAAAGFWGSGAIGILLDFLGWYFLIGVALDLYTLGAVAGSTYFLGTRTEGLYAAIEELAGEKSGINIVDKAQAAVSTTKVILALNSISQALKMNLEGQKPKLETLDRLNAMFILNNAEEKYNFRATDKFGVSSDEAGLIATQFAKYDANDDYRLEFSEFKRLCDDSNFDLSEEEIKVAMDLLDKRGSGYIEFDEFADWWVNSLGTAKIESSADKQKPKKS